MSYRKASEGIVKGDLFNNNEWLGHLLLVYPTEALLEFPTKHGDQDVIKGHVVVLDVQPPKVFYNTFFYGAGIFTQLKGMVGEKVLGRLQKGEARNGNSAPWQLSDWTDADVPLADAYTSANPDGPPLPVQQPQAATGQSGYASAAPAAPPAQQNGAVPPEVVSKLMAHGYTIEMINSFPPGGAAAVAATLA